MKNKTIKKLITTAVTGALFLNMIASSVGAETQYYDNDAGEILSNEITSSTDLVNPFRNYYYSSHGDYQGAKSVVSVENIDNLFDYVVMEPLTNDYAMPDLSHVKYIAIHETGNTDDTSWATNNFCYFTKVVDNAHFIIDDNTVIKAMELNEVAYALGNTDPAKSDVFNTNSISIEMCVNGEGDYLRTVANTVYVVRDLKDYLPNFKAFKQHADAWSEGRNESYADSFQKDCPTIMRAESTWWTWDRFVFFAENEEYPIPFIDFNPTIESEVPDNLKEYLGYDTYKADDVSKLQDTPKAENISKKEETSKKEDAQKTEEVSKSQEVSKIEEVSKPQEVSTLEEKTNTSLVKIDAASSDSEYVTKNSIFIDSNLNDNELLEFDRYIDIDAYKILNNIKENSKDIKLNDNELKELVRSVVLNCKLEKINPLIVIELMNSYTGYFTYGGSVTKEQNNYGGLKNKKGDFIEYSNINEGVVAFVQYIKTLTTNSRLKTKSENKDALKRIKKNSVKEFSQLASALDVQDSFLESVAKRVLSY